MSVLILFASAMMAAVPASSAGALVLRAQVTSVQPRVFLGDVVAIKALPLPLRRLASRVEVARFEGNTTAQQVTGAEIARRIRLRAPVLTHWLAPAASSSVVHIRYIGQTQISRIAPDKSLPGRGCLQTRRALALGEEALSGDFDKIDCPAHYNFVRTYRYDRSGSIQTVRAIAAHEVIPRFAGYDRDIVSPGHRMRLVSVAGSVSVAREVEVLQSARQGTKTFVRSSDGAIFPLLYAGQGQ